MHANLTLSVGTLYAFLLVLTRMGGVLVFVPLPGLRSMPEPVKAMLALSFTMALAARWPAVDPAGVTGSRLVVWVLSEAALGVAIGVVIAIIMEAFVLAAQVAGLQAGYAYSSTIDPNTDADSGVLLVVAQLMGGMLFFACGLDREVLRLFAQTLEKVPPGSYTFNRAAAESLIRLGSMIFSTGARMAMPLVALLVMVDIAMALLGRINSHLQLLSLSFPAKMLTALMVLSWVTALFPRILREMSGHGWITLHRMLGI